MMDETLDMTEQKRNSDAHTTKYEIVKIWLYWITTWWLQYDSPFVFMVTVVCMWKIQWDS